MARITIEVEGLGAARKRLGALIAAGHDATPLMRDIGEDINAYSASPEEGEVLLRAGTRMRVTKESKKEGRVTYIYVEEVDDGEV